MGYLEHRPNRSAIANLFRWVDSTALRIVEAVEDVFGLGAPELVLIGSVGAIGGAGAAVMLSVAVAAGGSIPWGSGGGTVAIPGSTSGGTTGGGGASFWADGGQSGYISPSPNAQLLLKPATGAGPVTWIKAGKDIHALFSSPAATGASDVTFYENQDFGNNSGLSFGVDPNGNYALNYSGVYFYSFGTQSPTPTPYSMYFIAKTPPSSTLSSPADSSLTIEKTSQNVGIATGTATLTDRFQVKGGGIRIETAGYGLKFPNGSIQTSAGARTGIFTAYVPPAYANATDFAKWTSYDSAATGQTSFIASTAGTGGGSGVLTFSKNGGASTCTLSVSCSGIGTNVASTCNMALVAGDYISVGWTTSCATNPGGMASMNYGAP